MQVAMYYQKNLTEVQIDQFAQDTIKVDEKTLSEAFEMWRNKSHFMPTPADINAFTKKEPVSAWTFCNELLGKILSCPIPGPGQKSKAKDVLTAFEFHVYTNNRYKDAIRQQLHKQAVFSLMQSLEEIKNNELNIRSIDSVDQIKWDRNYAED